MEERFFMGLYICTCHFLTCVKGLGAINVMTKSLIRYFRQVPKSHVVAQILISMEMDKLSLNMRYQQCGICDQQRLRPACAYEQSDQSLC